MTGAARHLIKLLHEQKAFYCAPDQRVLDAALDAGISLPHSCRGGNCGRCAARVVIGDYAYDRQTPAPGISADQRASGLALLCQIVPRGPMTIETARSAADGLAPTVRLPCRIVRREAVAEDVMKLTLQLPRTQPMDFRPGQHLDVLLERGRRRTYSLASLPYSLATGAVPSDGLTRAATDLELHVRRVPHGVFSGIAFDAQGHSSLLRIEGPSGDFGWREHGGPALMIAGGTGYAPVKSMLLAAIAQGRTQPVHLFWGARNRQDLYELEQLHAWSRQHPWFSFTPVAERDTGSGVESGRVDEIALAQFSDLADAMVYVSGPPGLVESVVAECRRRGISDARLVTDAFDHAR